MKRTTKTSRTAGYLEKIFRRLNDNYFNGELEEPIITIAPTKNAYGHITCSKIWKRNDDSAFEINISSYYIDRPIEEVVSTLLHEMVHEYNLMRGIQDCSRGGTYHNTKFRDKAESVDLHIEHDPRYGWTITSPTDKLLEFIISEGWEDISIGRDGGYGTYTGTGSGNSTGGKTPTTPTVPKKQTSWKYVCPSCGLIVRSTRDLTMKLGCIDCGTILLEA